MLGIFALTLAAREKEVEIRVVNRSSALMREVQVQFSEQTEYYGDIAPGAATAYRSVTKAYSYAYVEALIDGRKGVLQPIDFVGEQLLSGGKYSYVLTYNPKARDQFELLLLDLQKN